MLAACSLPRISTCTPAAAVFGTRASAMERFKVGEKVPLVTSPAGVAAHDFLMAAQHAALVEQQADELAGGRRGAACSSARRPTKSRLGRIEGHRPGQARLQGMMIFIHVVAVQIHAGFQTQRVSRAQAGGFDALRAQCRPCRGGVGRRQHHLESILTGITGARDEPRVERARRRKAPMQAPWRAAPAPAAPSSCRGPSGPGSRSWPGRVARPRSRRRGPACARIHARSLSRVPALTTRRY